MRNHELVSGHAFRRAKRHEKIRALAPAVRFLPVPEIVLSFEEARRVVEREAAKIDVSAHVTMRAALATAFNRILAEDILADRDLPPFPRSTRDGYAVRSAAGATKLELIGEIRAGITGELPTIKAGECAAIMTGAPLPPGADAVIMIEHTALEGNTVSLQRPVAPGQTVVP